LLHDSIRFRWKEEYREMKSMPGEEDSSTTNQPEKRLGSLALSVPVETIMVSLMSFSPCKKTPARATALSYLGRDFPHSSFEWFDKGLNYVPLLSITSSDGDMKLHRDR